MKNILAATAITALSASMAQAVTQAGATDVSPKAIVLDFSGLAGLSVPPSLPGAVVHSGSFALVIPDTNWDKGHARGAPILTGG